jgi:hypothetical protein
LLQRYLEKLRASFFSQGVLHDHSLPTEMPLEIILKICNYRQVDCSLRSVRFPKKGLSEGGNR